MVSYETPMNTMRLWDMKEMSPSVAIPRTDGDGSIARAELFNSRLVVVGNDGVVRIWNVCLHKSHDNATVYLIARIPQVADLSAPRLNTSECRTLDRRRKW